MSYEKDLRDLLLPLLPAGNNVYPDATPANPPAPFIVYQQVGGEAYWYVENKMPGKANARVQISVFAASRLDATALMFQVQKRLCEQNNKFAVRPIGAPINDYDEALELYGSLQDFSIQYDNTGVTPEPPIGNGYVDGNGDTYVDSNNNTYVGS